MNYYINRNKIDITEADKSIFNKVSENFNDTQYEDVFVKLNDDQVAFYLANPTLSMSEIWLMRPNLPVEIPLEELKANKRTQIEQAYTKMASDNLDVQLPPLVWDGFKLGMPKCSATVSWLMQMEIERSGKIDAVLAAVDKAELDLVSTNPSQLVKPFLASELFDEYTGWSNAPAV